MSALRILDVDRQTKVGAVTHGATYKPEYTAWAGMMQRCRNPANRRYASYGGRGIKVCDKWNDFAAFYKDVGPRPSSEHSLDRIDNDGPYAPHNCRWATRSEQQKNKGVYRRDHSLPRGDDHWTHRNKEHAQKIARANIKNAHGSGVNNNNAKLNQATAEKIRAAYAADPSIRMVDLGRIFGVGRETARKVVRGIAW